MLLTCINTLGKDAGEQTARGFLTVLDYELQAALQCHQTRPTDE